MNVNVNGGRCYFGSDSPRVAASTPGSSYPFSIHGVGRGGMYVYVCMYVCVCVWRQPPGPGALPRVCAGSRRAWAMRGTRMSRMETIADIIQAAIMLRYNERSVG